MGDENDNGEYDNTDENGNAICKVYDRNDFFTLAVQMILAFLALGSLYIKRMQEVPKRNLQTWSLDVSKQALGACYAHVLNMVRRECLVEPSDRWIRASLSSCALCFITRWLPL
jgi:hypothetical protein